jgi:hypothetical protein
LKADFAGGKRVDRLDQLDLRSRKPVHPVHLVHRFRPCNLHLQGESSDIVRNRTPGGS